MTTATTWPFMSKGAKRRECAACSARRSTSGTLFLRRFPNGSVDMIGRLWQYSLELEIGSKQDRSGVLIVSATCVFDHFFDAFRRPLCLCCRLDKFLKIQYE